MAQRKKQTAKQVEKREPGVFERMASQPPEEALRFQLEVLDGLMARAVAAKDFRGVVALMERADVVQQRLRALTAD